MTTPSQPPTWAPEACTLPTAERPLRLAEFDDLFTGLTSLDRLSPDHVRLHLAGAAGLEDTVRDLTARETECCSFFTFATAPVPSTEGDQITLDIRAASGHAAVLEALARQAQTVAAQGKVS